MFDELEALSQQLNRQNRESLAESWPGLLEFHKLTDDEAGDKAMLGILRKHVAEHLEPLGVSENSIEKIFLAVFPSPTWQNGKRVFI